MNFLVTLYAFFFENVPKYKFFNIYFFYIYSSICTNLPWTNNEIKRVKTIYN